jgi:hypothetical protein
VLEAVCCGLWRCRMSFLVQLGTHVWWRRLCWDSLRVQIPVVQYMNIKKNLQTHCCAPTLHGEHSSRPQISMHTSACRAHLPPWNESCCRLPVVQATSDSYPLSPPASRVDGDGGLEFPFGRTLGSSRGGISNERY